MTRQGKIPGEEMEGLRRGAEERLAAKSAGLAEKSLSEIQNLVHELQVHQVELEMQGLELRRAQADLEEALKKYADLYDYSPAAHFTVDENGWIIKANLTAARFLGVEPDRLIQHPLAQFILEADRRKFWNYIQGAVKEEPCPPLELGFQHAQGGRSVGVLNSLKVWDSQGKAQVHLSLIDLTALQEAEANVRLRQEEVELAARISEICLTFPGDEMYGEVLELVLGILQSRYGVFGYLDQNGDLVAPSMTRGVWEECQVLDKKIVFPRSSWGGGTWSRSLLGKRTICQNQPSVLTPPGHIIIHRHVSRPIIYQDKAIGLLQVANKATDYDKRDLDLLDMLSHQLAPILHARLQQRWQEAGRLQAEAALRQHARQVQALLDLHSLADAPRQQILDFVLKSSLELMQSEFAFVGLMDEAELVMSIDSWSPGVMGGCTLDRQPTMFSISEAGAWGEFLRQQRPVMVNDYQAPQAGKKGLPAGHVPIRRFLAVPVFVGPRLVAAAVVANKATDYTEDDIKAFTALLNKAWEILSRQEMQEAFRDLVNSAPTGIFILQKGKFKLINPGFREISGYSEQELLGLKSLELVPPDYRDEVRQNAIDMIKGKSQVPYEFPIVTKSGQIRWVMEKVAPTTYLGQRAILGYFLDISERRSLEAQFLQAQKMEAVGRLAGGVAHDFNNMLNIILGYSEFMKMQLNEDDPLVPNMEEIIKAGRRAATLTQQLLAFSRKQIIEPQILNLNEKIVEVEKMLRRLIGEDIDLTTDLAPALAAVKADPGQIDQIIMNLAVNAREAMPQGGTLTLETANVNLDEAYTRTHAYVIPGPYVMLAMSDTGQGMDTATQTRIFEPFFTTKKEGTGLGLATVYGIVKQNNGYIIAYSEPGRGTTFKIYFPQVKEEVSAAPAAGGLREEELYGSETILLVEDDDAMRALTRSILANYRYRVLEASNGREALRLWEGSAEPIHLVLTDVVMPQMSGRELVDRLKLLKPDLKVVYMSGYTTDAVVHHGVVESKVPFIQKPFAVRILLGKIRKVLDKAG